MPESRQFHHHPLPNFSTLLSGREPRNHELAWQSEQLQVWFNNSVAEWTDPGPHAHSSSDEIFIVLEGTVVVEVGGRRVPVGPDEFCCFPAGLSHQIVETKGPLRTLMLRAPSIDDKQLT
jgi:mannose-6-phosphate isomerase-like protein (cupin superfamily)